MHLLFLCLHAAIFSCVRHLSSVEASSPVLETTELDKNNETSSDNATNTLLLALLSFNCSYKEENELEIFCSRVHLPDVAPNIPNDTAHLEITRSPLQVFRKPFLSHLHKLRNLKLNHNHHKFITSNAFEGLNSLKVLDLSFNDIIVLSKAFKYTTNLEVLNLTSNKIINVKTVATALSHLGKFQNLTLNHNVDIRSVSSDSLTPFANTSLVTLELYNTTIQMVEEEAFKPLRHLRLLVLSVNYLDESGLRNVTSALEKTSIRVLILQQLNLHGRVPYEALIFLRNTSIEHLDMSYNYFPDIQEFPSIPTLTTLELSFCSVRKFLTRTFDGLPNLESLDLSNNKIFYFKGFSLSRLKNLYLKNQRPHIDGNSTYFADFAFKNISTLVRLDLANVKTTGNVTRYMFYGLHRLEQLHFRTSKIDLIRDYAFETLVSLKYLNLKNNRISHLTNYTFFGLSQLRNISLSRNYIKFIEGIDPFQNSPYLSFIDLNNNQIVEIPDGMFSTLLFLNVLVLFSNKIVAWNSTILSGNASVSVMLLSKNKIAYITPAMIADFLFVNEALDITENPFNCTACGMKNFQTFMNETNVSLTFGNVYGTYTCDSPEEHQGDLIMKIDIPTSHCLPDEINMALFVVTLMLSLIFCVVSIASVCYIFRWYIRYVLFHLEAVLKERRHSKTDLHQYLYDAFVSYNASDTPWVVSHLIPALEEQEPVFKLCIHERDFEVGRLITDNIFDTIEVSRKVILLLSESFLSSEWCMFELHMAQHKLFDETRDVLVLVKLRNINKKLYTHNLKYLEKTRPCLTWTDNPTGQVLFWDKMRKILRKPSVTSEVVERF